MNAKIKVTAQINAAPNCVYPGMKEMIEKDISVPPKGTFNLPIWKPDLIFCGDVRWSPPFTIRYEPSTQVDITEVPIHTYAIRCTSIDDGKPCNPQQKCGGGYCVRGICTNSTLCFNDDCKCAPETEAQCTDNKRCVTLGAIHLGVKPKCNLSEECVTGYLNQTTGMCAKSPDQRDQENLIYWILIIIGLIVVPATAIILVFYFKTQSEEARQKRLQAETELVISQILKRNMKLEQSINGSTKSIDKSTLLEKRSNNSKG